MKKTALLAALMLAVALPAHTESAAPAAEHGFSGSLTAAAQAPEISAAAYAVYDMQSRMILAENGLDSRVEPASLTKLMTAYLVFKALEEGRLRPEDTFTVSEHGWKTEGSRMFLDPKRPASVSDLLKGLIIQSGNDAAVTLAEAVAGSEPAFVELMNAEAKRLGMNETRFQNSSGLPGPEHHTSAKDLLLLSEAIIRDYPQHYPIYAEKSFTYNQITQANRNLLLYRDPDVDGIKTGHTATAGYNLIASSKRNGRRIITVVIGTESMEARAGESGKLLNWALQTFDTAKLYSADQAVETATVYKGKADTVALGFTEDTYLTVPHGSQTALTPVVETVQPVIAPITRGQVLGRISFTDDKGQTLAVKDIVALEDVAEAGFFGRLWDGIALWFKSLFNGG